MEISIGERARIAAGTALAIIVRDGHIAGTVHLKPREDCPHARTRLVHTRDRL